MMKKPQLFVVATPIGNKKDLGQRAVEVLKNVDFIACEDCRTSKKLLDELGVETKLVSYHKFNEKQRTNELLKLFEEGCRGGTFSPKKFFPCETKVFICLWDYRCHPLRVRRQG